MSHYFLKNAKNETIYHSDDLHCVKSEQWFIAVSSEYKTTDELWALYDSMTIVEYVKK